MSSTTKKTPKCKFCDVEILWGLNLPNNKPADPVTKKEHVCDPERKKAHQANLAAENLAREKAANMGGGNNSTNNNDNQLSGIEVYLKGQSEELRRAVDHLSRIAMFAENIDFHVKKIDARLTYSRVPEGPVLTSESESSSQQEAEEFPNDT
ncbi:MAG: hypothetical protein R2685_08105 [Candidatus Nitrosocosmicus sp.]|nr:hypothetical protein [Candidatus Nitrosocosmicus sp.]